jgi:hypothetical protein
LTGHPVQSRGSDRQFTIFGIITIARTMRRRAMPLAFRRFDAGSIASAVDPAWPKTGVKRS